MSQTSRIQELVRKHFLENNHKTKNPDWITVHDSSLVKLILESFADEEKKMILDATLHEPRNILEILEITKISRTSGYRKINSLIDNGFLLVQGHLNVRDMKNGKKYKSIFENITININQNSVGMKILLTKESLKKYTTIEITKN
jgi:hypothetical protein